MSTKFHALMTMDMFVNISIRGLQIIFHITKVNTYFVKNLNSWFAQPTKNPEIKCPTNKDDLHSMLTKKSIKFMPYTCWQ